MPPPASCAQPCEAMDTDVSAATAAAASLDDGAGADTATRTPLRRWKRAVTAVRSLRTWVLVREDSAAARAERALVQREVTSFVRSQVSLRRLSQFMAARASMARERAAGMAALRRLLRVVPPTATGLAAVLRWLPQCMRGPAHAPWLRRGAGAAGVGGANASDAWHYTDGLESCGADLLTALHDEFCALYTDVTTQLDRAVSSRSPSLVLLLLQAWGLVVAPIDHELMNSTSLFIVLQRLLSVTLDNLATATSGVKPGASVVRRVRLGSSASDEASAGTAAAPAAAEPTLVTDDSAALTFDGESKEAYVAMYKTLEDATIQLVVLLVVQVRRFRVSVWIVATTSQPSPHALLRQLCRWCGQCSPTHMCHDHACTVYRVP